MRTIVCLLFAVLLSPLAFAQKFACSISAPAMHLGTYSGSRVATGVTPVSVICPPSTPYTVSLRSSDRGSVNSVRAMKGVRGHKLSYQLFQDASRSINWGSEIGTNVLTGVGSGTVQRFNIYPVLMQSQDTPQGEYTDTLTATVTSNRGVSSASIPVAASAIGVCVLSSSSMVFGNYAGAAVNNTATISLTCVGGTVFDIALNAGSTSGATTSTRKMTGPNGGTLNYHLYRDAAHSQNWGSISGTDTLVSTGLGLLQSITIYGEIPKDQIVPLGSYSDTVTATITY